MKRNREAFNEYNVIDVHTHIGFSDSMLELTKFPSCQNIIDLLNAMKHNDVGCSVSFPFPHFIESGNGIPYELDNKRLLLEVNSLKINNILPFLMVSLVDNIDGQLDFLKDMCKTYEVYGLKYYADFDRLNLYEFKNRGEKVIDFCIKNDLPILFHCSGDAVVSENSLSDSLAVLELASLYPGLRVCIAHMGHFKKETINYLSSSEAPDNIFIDCSPFLHICNVRTISDSSNCIEYEYGDPISVLKRMFDDEFLSKHVVWGSDKPFNFTCDLVNPAHDKNFMNKTYSDNWMILKSVNGAAKLFAHDNVIRFLFGE